MQKFEQTLLSTRATNESAACIGQGFFLSTEGSILLSEKLPQYYFLVNKALLCRSVLFVKPKQTKPAHCQSKTIFHGHSKEFFENETNILSMSSNQDVGILMSTKEINCYIKNLIIVFTSKSLYLFLLQPKSPFFLTACASSHTWPGTCIMVWACLFCPSAKDCPLVPVCLWALICLTVRASFCIPRLFLVSLCSSLFLSELGSSQFILIISLSLVLPPPSLKHIGPHTLMLMLSVCYLILSRLCGFIHWLCLVLSVFPKPSF